MTKLVGTVAMVAALVAVVVSLGQDLGAMATLKRAGLSYFAFYVVGSVLVVVFRSGIEDEWIRDEMRRKEEAKRRREREMQNMN